MDRYGITDLPAMIVFPAIGEEGFVRYEGERFSKAKLQMFLSKQALKKMVLPQKKEQTGDSKADDGDQTNVKMEL